MLLMALLEGPAHGYEVIRRLEERSDGQWRPSPGSVYPALQLLEEEGNLSAHDDGGKKVYELTEAGRALAEEVAARRPVVPWDTEEGPAGSARGDLRSAIGQLHLAARQVAEVADQARVEQAVAIVNEARRKLYQLLAES